MELKDYKQLIEERANKLILDTMGRERLVARSIADDARHMKFNYISADDFVRYQREQMLGDDFALIGADSLRKFYEGIPSPPIEVGTPCTIMYYSDRRAATITEVKHNRDGKPIEIGVKHNEVKCLDYYAGDYEIKPELTGEPDWFTLRRGGRWIMRGHLKKDGVRLAIGYHHHYIDPHF